MRNSFVQMFGIVTLLVAEGKAYDAQSFLDSARVKGGLIVVIGCDDPVLAERLRPNHSYIVQCLDRNAANVAFFRQHLLQKGLYGPITATLFTGRQLPYVDRIVNLLVICGGADDIARDEIMRVLTPTGVFMDARHPAPRIIRSDWPAAFDEWTHDRYDASNNAVSHDIIVGPPRGLRWTCGPAYAASHEHFAGISAMVTAGGRLFYIIDEGPTSSVFLPASWKLVARDAFNGVLLWKRSIGPWESRLRGFRSGPPEIGRRLVAMGDRVYATLGYGEPVTVLEAATGRHLQTVMGTEGARELACHDETLYVLADDMTAAAHEQRKEEIERIVPTLDIWYRFPRKAFPMYGTQRIVAIDTTTGKRRWSRAFEQPGEVMPTTMAIDSGRVCFQTTSYVFCLDAMSGEEKWRSPRPVARSRFSWSTPTLVVHNGVVLSIDRSKKDNADKAPPTQGSKWIISSGGFENRQDAELIAFALDSGKQLWRAPYSENYNVPADVFVIDGVVWVGNLRAGADPGYTHGRDLRTGKIVTTIPPQKAWGHHRCYRNKATVNWLLVGRGGIQFINPGNGNVDGNSWVRGTCQYGTMPANGLIYTPQHSCACQPEEMLIGMNALTPRSSAAGKAPSIEVGPAYGEEVNSRTKETAWPTYRGDSHRSGFRDIVSPKAPTIGWTAELASPITAPVSTDGLVFVAEIDRHTLHALATDDGKPTWKFTADGRIDSPPTLQGGYCLFGTRSGSVYCLRTSDGRLVWRFRAALCARRLMAYEQLESVWPVHGSVLVNDTLSGSTPVVYFAAGRSARLDEGIRLYALDVATGEVLHEADISMGGGSGGARSPGTSLIRESVLPDILSLERETIWMRGLGLNANLERVGDLPHLFAPRGFLDDNWWHRTYWIHGTEVGGGYQGWPRAGNTCPAGRLLVLDGGEFIYGYGRLTYREGAGHVSTRATNDYRLFAEKCTPEMITRLDARGEESRRPGQRRFEWSQRLPFLVRALVLARDALVIAGDESMPRFGKNHGHGTLAIASREDGARLGICPLPAPPVLDGMALTKAGIFLSTINGKVVFLQDSSRRGH